MSVATSGDCIFSTQLLVVAKITRKVGTFLTSSEVVLALAVFLSAAVEMVEALTVVLAAGVTRGWKSSLEGALAAFAVLAAIVAAFGPALVRYVPLDLLRAVVGGVLLIFGLQWLRKAVLRASGLKESRDEDLVYKATVKRLSVADRTSSRDMQAFTVAFKGVFIEGLEVIIIVLTLGSSAHDLGLAVVSATTAAVLVALAGLVVARQLSNVPENAMKLVVGLMLVSFGTFWGGEGLGIHWPGSDLMIPALIVVYGAVAWLSVKWLERYSDRDAPTKLHEKDFSEASESSGAGASGYVKVRTGRKVVPARLVEGFVRFWWEFLIGDTPEIFVGALVIFGAVEMMLHAAFTAIFMTVAAPFLVVAVLSTTLLFASRSGKY